MQAFELDVLISQQDPHTVAYLEFLRSANLSVGLYHLPSGSTDPQQPHSEDEVYYIARGRGHIRVGDEDRVVQTGSIVYVAAGVAHHFHSISQDLDILVFFAPAEYTRRTPRA
ncbi:MAG: cupin domain-containing protein [Anaerolineae bacterium]